MNTVETESPPEYVPRVSTADFEYELPEERIAAFPLSERDQSRLLVCDVASESIEHLRFDALAELIPSDSLMIINNTRVVRARIVLHKETGGRVEFLLLEPIDPSRDPAVTMAATRDCSWVCMIGGAKKLRNARELRATLGEGPDAIELTAIVEERLDEGFRVRFRWRPVERSFAEVLDIAGHMPLPPYIKRDDEESDSESYQTVYAEREGAVAAPTAGLHFTPAVLGALVDKGVRIERVTLHVGAGTFKQMESDDVREHRMHRERISVTGPTLRSLAEWARKREEGSHPFVIVGTTSLRTVESLYWFGARLLLENVSPIEFNVEQWDPYRLASEYPQLPGTAEAFERVEAWRADLGLDAVTGRTGVLIVPGYEFKACDALLTNFHQPGSTLIMLVGAMLGREMWKRVYGEALLEGYRFLSYGDSSLLIPANSRNLFAQNARRQGQG
jgi:S-adenosylmethionine:tRNA ribosyltransferase-isomerase